MFRGKKYKEIAKQIDKAALYDPKEGLELICKTASAKFDETVELHVKLGVDSRHADQQVRGAVVLPNGSPRATRLTLPARLAPTSLAIWIWSRRSRRKTGSISMWSSLLPT